jgi:hypothetical protein
MFGGSLGSLGSDDGFMEIEKDSSASRWSRVELWSALIFISIRLWALISSLAYLTLSCLVIRHDIHHTHQAFNNYILRSPGDTMATSISYNFNMSEREAELGYPSTTTRNQHGSERSMSFSLPSLSQINLPRPESSLPANLDKLRLSQAKSLSSNLKETEVDDDRSVDSSPQSELGHC